MIKRLQPYAVGVPCYYTAQFQRSFVPHTLGLWNGLLVEVTELETQKFKWSCNAITMDNLSVFSSVFIFSIFTYHHRYPFILLSFFVLFFLLMNTIFCGSLLDKPMASRHVSYEKVLTL